MIRRFTSSPNPAVRVALIHRGHVIGVNAQPVAHAIVTSEIASTPPREQ